ncbi:DUF342 domain-containing protein [Oceanospirillum sp. D5]|uniref:DUF342 domain-containing protein n=2 Tax=Oceanospirillum sediminis TaxID=2760088 RepID=A0A839ISD3_9GAMM|nr:DUF342 domain-containing protein [Oceanospirillum sediminis]
MVSPDKENKHMDITEELQNTNVHQDEDQAQPDTGLEYILNEAGTRVIARYQPTQQMLNLTADDISQQVKEAGFPPEDFPLFEDRVRDLVIGIRQRKSFEIELGGPVDANISIHLSMDETLASVQITPPMGKGLPASREAFDTELQKNRIRIGINEELINEIFADGPVLNITEACCYLIAHGKKAIDGKDSDFIPLVEQVSERRPRILKDSQNKADYKELGEFPVYPEETRVFRLTEPVAGIDGMTVTGKPIRAYHGKELKLKMDKTVRPDYEDRRVYVSTVKGMPVFTEKGVHIENVLQVDEVSLATGNVRYDGSIQVKKGVNPGMLVEASGDIRVGGLVDSCTVTAGGNIEVKGGIMGQKSPDLKAEAPTKENAVVRAKGNIQARFIQDAWVESNGSISAQKLIMHSRIWAENSIKLAASGQFVGGHAIAGEYIEGGQLGVPASVPTLLEVGPLDHARDEMSKIQQKIKDGFEQARQLKQLIHRIREEHRRVSPEKKEQILKARDTIKNALKALEHRRQELEETIQTRKKARVKALKKAYSGCNITIADVGRQIKDDFGKTIFYLDAGEIKIR